MASTPFQMYLGRSDFVEVGMNDLQILLPGLGKKAIGTRNLNGCTAVAILGDALLVAHISPRADPRSPGEDHLKRHLASISSLYTRYRNYFPEHTTTWTFFGTLGGSPMQHVVNEVQAHLKRDGLHAKPNFYPVAPATTKGLAAGEMIAAIRPKAVELYFEKCLIETKPLPKNENEGDDDEDNNDDDDSNDDDDEEDDGDSGDEDVKPNSPVQASTSGPSGSQSFSWERLNDGKYIKIDRNRKVILQQSNPPVNEVFTQGGKYFYYNGRTCFVGNNGEWKEVSAK
ncbi:hypothetical protein KC343_g7726 [Hortaea werneckii]|nr:hypothetical protein KC365_g17480 [Hortaea werneckii]KAI7229925.1 hypothetical protein KC352_g15374 [Hortaea werneckii]KAI7564154.1 hypothetical protein KC317_g7240 [Hortaea werneckii]KAI7614432.1 hypothetical protein KC346_g6924 [Hortaea werneckii]KAI7622206.1 hypothetical protein KC343_g7726 [Hortaea werneckii]